MFLDVFLDGLGLGAIYAFIALGYTMVYGIIKLINFAHGEFFMVGAFTGYFVLRDAGIERVDLPQPLPILLSLLVALTAASLAAGLLAVVTERIAYRPVRRAGRIAALLTAVGVSFFLQNLAIQVWGAGERAYPDPRVWVAVEALDGEADATYRVPGETEAVIAEGEVVDAARRQALVDRGHTHVFRTAASSKRDKQLLILLALVLWTPILWFLVMRTRTGKAMRAVSEDQDAALLMGINIDRVVAATFFIGAFIAGVGGVGHAMTYGAVKPLAGWLPGLKAFIAAVIGGIGSIPGAIVGGLLLGVVEFVVPWLLEAAGWEGAKAFKDALAYVFLIVILLVKPTGLFGTPVREKV